jgi:hypothetical protein
MPVGGAAYGCSQILPVPVPAPAVTVAFTVLFASGVQEYGIAATLPALRVCAPGPDGAAGQDGAGYGAWSGGMPAPPKWESPNGTAVKARVRSQC